MRRITLECAWVKLETPATHEKYRARQRRINEAGDSVPDSQRRVLDLQLSDTPATPTALPAPTAPPMPHSRRPTQTGRDSSNRNTFVVLSVVQIQQPSEEPRATASCCTWCRNMVGNSSSKKALSSCANSTVWPQSGREGVIAAAVFLREYSHPRSHCC